MNKVIVTAISFFVFASACIAQTVKVKKETTKINNQSAEGYTVTLDAPASEVLPALQKYFKELGKLKQHDGTLWLTDAAINGAQAKTPIYGTAPSAGASSTRVWLGICPDEWPENQTERLLERIDKLTYDFGVKFYKDKIQVQIDESTEALQAVQKQQRRLENEQKSLQQKLQYNEQEKARLEKNLVTNSQEHELLLHQLEKNKHDQDSVATAAGQVSKVVEMHKDRKNQVK